MADADFKFVPPVHFGKGGAGYAHKNNGRIDRGKD